jgi:small subunit ribosomal protein S9
VSNQNEILATGVGRRKSSIAEIRILEGNGNFTINGKNGFLYMQHDASCLLSIQAPLDIVQLQKKYNIDIKVYGGGLKGQSQAIKLAIAKALCTMNQSYRGILKTKGYLTRDARCKERKKYGLKKARKAPQFSKR